jgi:hypothetical protein
MKNAGVLLLLVSAPLFAQSMLVLPKLTDGYRAQTPARPSRPAPKLVARNETPVCSIPLLQAKLAANVEKMPQVKPPANAGSPRELLSNVPAPACER